jgi:hypothetical protein
MTRAELDDKIMQLITDGGRSTDAEDVREVLGCIADYIEGFSGGNAGDKYLYGSEFVDGSVRFHYDLSSDEAVIQKRIAGVWVTGTTIVAFS